MVGTKTTGLATGTPDPAVDWLSFVDVSDTTMAASGTNKKMLADNLRFSVANGASGTTPRTPKAKFTEMAVSVADFGALANGTDCAAVFRAADAWCAANGSALYIPPGTWTFTTPFSGTASPYTPILSSWRGAGRQLTTLRVTHSTASRTFRIGYGSGTVEKMRAQSRSQASPFNTVYAINDVGAGQRFITFTTLADLTALIASSGIAVGQLWHVAGGKNAQDADDSLWYYDQLHRVQYIDAAGGKVYFEDAIDYVLTSQGWDGSGAGKNLAATYANATVYAAGAYVWDDVATSTLYVTPAGGTSNSANRSTDTGNVWRQVTTALVALKTGAVDHRPVFQKSFSQIQGLTFSDMTLDWSSTSGSIFIEISGAYNIVFERCDIRGGTVYPVEASRYITFRDCDLDRGTPDGLDSQRNAINTYNARKVKLLNCRVNGGNTSTVSTGNRVIKLESHSEIICENTDISNVDPAAPQGYGALIDRGEFYMVGGSMRGFRDPVRYAIQDYYEEIVPIRASIDRAEVHIIGKNFRLGTSTVEAPAIHYRHTNRYIVRDPYSSGSHIQTDNFQFAPTRYHMLTMSFTPATNQAAVVLEVTKAALAGAGIENVDAVSMVFLGGSVIWETPGANDLEIRFRAKHVTSAALRNLFSTTSNSNRIVVNSTTPQASKFLGDGTGYRLLQSGVDRLQLNYTSGAAAGGTCYIICHILI